ncbi:MAG: hypothetical protein HQ570_03585 [Candidatus Omnitrophica bacterium]|nr:hypothetical protein [Candidatus Omnitrophota bacterium]
MRKKKVDDQALKIVLQELKEDPRHKFNIAFSLMSIVPLLVFFYILVNRLFTIDILIGNIGFMLAGAILISICGFYIGYSIIRNILAKIITYAVQAKRSDQLKSKFVALVSHELKNPLSTIQLSIFNMLKGIAGDVTSEQKRILGVCRNVVDRMNRLINNLLDLHKIEAGMDSGKRELCNFSQILDEQTKEFNDMFNKKSIKVDKEIANDKLFLWGDKDKISQVMNNLIGNAAKHTPEGGSVNLKAVLDNNFLRLECVNSGPSIPADKLTKIFNKFERANTKEEGAGLGLMIAKDIVEFHKGKIWAEDLAGKGSKFTVLLPCNLRKGRGSRDEQRNS